MDINKQTDLLNLEIDKIKEEIFEEFSNLSNDIKNDIENILCYYGDIIYLQNYVNDEGIKPSPKKQITITYFLGKGYIKEEHLNKIEKLAISDAKNDEINIEI